MFASSNLAQEAVDDVVRRALDEDVGLSPGAPRGELPAGDDVTSLHAIDGEARAVARLVAKEPGRLAGLDVFARTFELGDAGSRFEAECSDGVDLAPGDVVGRVHGSARALLRGERPALNLLQHLCGVATLTARFVAASGGKARVLDTRKTTPGLRVLERYAVRCGGGENHRFGLHDQAMVKNNHADLAGRPLERVVEELRERLGPHVTITCEARDEAEALAGIAGGADVVLLDNFTPRELGALCPRLRAAAAKRERPLELEASGGVRLDSIAAIAASGVDRVSVGALTHSAAALDLSLYLEPQP